MLITSAIISGLSLGSMYGLIALGYHVTYIVSNTVNFSQGSAMMLGAVLGYTFAVTLGWPYPLAAAMALILCALFGLVVERTLVRPFADRNSSGWLMATVAGGIVLDNAILFTFGKEPRSFSSALAEKPVQIFGAGVYPLQLLIPVVGLAIAIALQIAFQRTRIGKSLLAVVQNTDAARLMGINVRRAIAASFALSTVLAGLAGLLIAPLFSVHSEMGSLFGIKAFAVAILGGITSAWGVMLAGLAYGLIEALVTAYLGSVYTQIVAFSIVIAALALMPNGLLGRAAVKKSVTVRAARQWIVPLAIVLLTVAAVAVTLQTRGYTHFIIALVALTLITGVGLNILLGLAGQISFGHVGFYAIGAYTVAILMLRDVSFWIAFPAAGLISGAVGFLLALPALRVAGPYLAMVTIAFAFIVQHGTIEWRGLTGGANGLIGLPAPSLGTLIFGERETALFSVLLAGVSLLFFDRIAQSRWGKGMIAVRDSEVAAGSLGLDPVVIKTTAFALSAVFAGLAGGLFAPLLMFVAPDSFPFSQSILFLLAVIIGGAGFTFGPVIGAAISVLLPELLSGLAEYRLLFFGSLLLVVLWLAPEGVIGTLQRFVPRLRGKDEPVSQANIGELLGSTQRETLVVDNISLSFGGVKASQEVSFEAPPGKVTSVIGPNGAGKTTVLNMIGGFYAPDSGRIALGNEQLAGRSTTKIARAGIARTYQTTRLFGSLSVLDNVMAGLHNGKLGWLLARAASAQDRARAAALLDFVGYRGDLEVAAADLPHIDKRLVEIARALATRPKVLLLDEPAAGLMRSDKVALSKLLRQIADAGVAVILVEHDMLLVMGISDQITVLDAGRVIAQGSPQQIRRDPKVLKAYLGDGETKRRPRAASAKISAEPVLTALRLEAGYGGAPVIQDISFDVRQGEMVALLGANGAGKSTTMRVLSGLLRARSGEIVLDDQRIERLEASKIARRGMALVPEGRQVFPELSVRDNLALGAHTRPKADIDADIERMLTLFPRLRERISNRAGLLSGGEQQMLAIARGLMAKPAILLLDEPSLGLAPAIINEVFDTLATLRDDGVTVMLVDQMAALALTVADRGYVLESGQVKQSGDAATLAADPHLEAAYLGEARAAE